MKKVRKIVIYGDSISTTNHGEGGYEGYLREKFSAEVVNYAIGSSGLSMITPDNTAAILEREGNIPKDADLILMWHGSNDWYWGSPLGKMADENPDTFLGAVGMAVRRIRQSAPEAVFVWMTPIYRYEAPDEVKTAGYAYKTENKAGYTLLDYYQALQQASACYGFSVIDMHRLCGIHEGNHHIYLEDKVHPNKAGYERIFRVMGRKLEMVLRDAGYGV